MTDTFIRVTRKFHAVPAVVFEDHFQVEVRVLEHGPHAGQVLLIWQEGDHAVVRLVDPARPADPIRDLRTRPGVGVVFYSLDALDGSILLVAFDTASSQTDSRRFFI